MNDPRNIGIGPAGRAFMGALLRLGDALEMAPHSDSDGSPKGEDALAASSETTARAEGIAQTSSPKASPHG